MVVGRYRVLFPIIARKVHVLHVREAYVKMYFGLALFKNCFALTYVILYG
jgi:hypothetical protein